MSSQASDTEPASGRIPMSARMHRQQRRPIPIPRPRNWRLSCPFSISVADSDGTKVNAENHPCGSPRTVYCNIARLNEHLKRVHSALYICSRCDYACNISSIRELEERQAQHVCSVTTTQTRQSWSGSIRMTAEQQERWSNWKSRPVQLINRMWSPYESWRRIYKSIYPENDDEQALAEMIRRNNPTASDSIRTISEVDEARESGFIDSNVWGPTAEFSNSSIPDLQSLRPSVNSGPLGEPQATRAPCLHMAVCDGNQQVEMTWARDAANEDGLTTVPDLLHHARLPDPELRERTRQLLNKAWMRIPDNVVLGTGNASPPFDSSSLPFTVVAAVEGSRGISTEGVTPEVADPFDPLRALPPHGSAHEPEQQLRSESDFTGILDQDANNGRIETSTPLPTAPPTDSAYGSGPTLANALGSWNICDQVTRHPITHTLKSDLDDTATVYSDISSTTSGEKWTYIRDLAESIIDNLDPLRTDHDIPSRISAILPTLLQDFALKLGYRTASQRYQHVMVFVHRYRHVISHVFKNIDRLQADDASKEVKKSDEMSLEDRISDWWKRIGHEALMDPDSNAEMEHLDVEEDYHFSIYSDVLETNGYQWLLSQLRRELHLAVPDEVDGAKSIKETVKSALPTAQQVSRRIAPDGHLVDMQLDWDILGFLEAQEYTRSPAEILDDVITLTGSTRGSQAATTSQYMRQTWPVTGEECLKVLKEALSLSSKDARWVRGDLSDGTALSIRLLAAKVYIQVEGLATAIAEVAEQFAWLGAALRISPKVRGPVYCTPTCVKVERAEDEPKHVSGLGKVSYCSFRIEFGDENIPMASTSANGHCWNDLFRSPTVVKGYPIPGRTEWNTGLELPLSMMASLVGTQQVDRFKDRTYLKGFSAMLVPTKLNGEVITWHLLHNKDGSRISYQDDRVGLQEHINGLVTGNYRHILGWCSEANFYVGSVDARYLVAHTWLPRPSAGCIFNKTSIFRGMVIKGGPPFHIGSRDTPTQLVREGFISRLRWLANKMVLLWDEEDKRGWLVNGTSALLHLVRASMAQESTDGFQSEFLFPTENLQESTNPLRTTSAGDVLMNHRNQQIRLHAGNGDEGVPLKTRIAHFLNIMEKLIDHQADVSRHNEGSLSSSPRGILECWDFEDLAKSPNTDEVHARVVRLEDSGKGWVDFIRAVDAVTLAGCGFGDLIRPSNAHVCTRWSDLPKGEYYLAVCLSDLGLLAKQQGRHEDGHIRLSDNLVWHTPTTLVQPACQCGERPCDPVQTFFPTELSSLLVARQDNRIAYEGPGAVVFGHSSSFPWVWGDDGHPQQGRLVRKTVPTSPHSDSGIGQSMTSAEPLECRTASQSSVMSDASSEAPVTLSPRMSKRKATRSDPSLQYSSRRYRIGIICALPKELMAVRLLFDRTHKRPDVAARNEINQYVLGEMGRHVIVAACLPSGEYGTNSAAAVANNLARSFPLRFCLLVGIGGGVPPKDDGLRLGDVVVGLPTRDHPGVVQYDLGADMDDGQFELRGCLSPPPRELTTAISDIRSDPDLRRDPLRPYLDTITAQAPDYDIPGDDLDPRQPCKRASGPLVHYGLIGSGNRLIKSAKIRDQHAAERGILCFEMEAAGVIRTLPTLVIRGICDYCDENKNDLWQEYAAATAAAYARLLLEKVAAVNEDAAYDRAESRGQDWSTQGEERGDSPPGKRQRL